MEFIKNNFRNTPFSIVQYFKHLGVENQNEGNKLFKGHIENILNFQNTKSNADIRSFAQSVKHSEYSILDSTESLVYWVDIAKEKTVKRRVLTHFESELNVAEEISRSSNKRLKETPERTLDDGNTQLTPSTETLDDDDTQLTSSTETFFAKSSPSTSEIELLSIWELWSRFLATFLAEEDVHDFCLERLGIVQLGEHIGNTMARSSYPINLFQKTNQLLKQPSQDLFDDVGKLQSLMDLFVLPHEEVKLKLLGLAVDAFKSTPSPFTFSHNVVSIFINQAFEYKGLDKKEINYSYRLVWPLMDSISKNLPDITFEPGEVRLESIKEELKLQGLSTSQFYNADGVFKDEVYDCELALLEVSGPFRLDNGDRESKDYLKASYGLLAMLHYVARKFEYADVKIFKKFKVYFIQAANEKIRTWQFSLCDIKLYSIYRCTSSTLTLNYDGSKKNIEKFINNMWSFKENLIESRSLLKQLQDSHISRLSLIEKRGQGYQRLVKLSTYLEEFAEVKLDRKWLADADELLMTSSQ